MAKQSKVRLKVGLEEARQAILDALPKDAIIREEDDGVGRFAGQRTLVIIGRKRDRLMMFHGTYGQIKGHFEEPHLDVVFDTSKDRVVAKLIREEPKPPSAIMKVFDVLGYVVTVGAVVVAYHMFRDIEMDNQRIALVAVGGGLGWAAIAHYMPKREDLGLFDTVDKALAPHAVKKKKKKKAEPEARERAEEEPQEEPDDADAADER